MRTRTFYCMLALLLGLIAPKARAQRSEMLLPATTRGFVSVLDVDRLREKWNETQLGEMVRDPAMKPFVEDLRRQIEQKLSQTGRRLRIQWSDLDGVYAGEIAVAVIQPDGDVQQHALVMLVDVTGHLDEAKALLEQVWKREQAKGATRSDRTIEGVSVMVLSVVDPGPRPSQHDVFYAVHADRLVAVDHDAEMAAILKRLDGGRSETLATVPAFQQTMKKGQWEDREGEIRWFLEPFGYAETMRAIHPVSERKQDLVKVLSNQGFREAIQGIGGHIFLANGERDLVHRTLIYAPPVPRKADDAEQTRYRLAARMLDFPNTDNLMPHPFIPSTTATYLSLSWKMTEAFEYSKTLVNELIGSAEDQDLFEEVIGGMATDPDGPRVDIRKEIVQHLATRATLIGEPKLPITTKSEQILAMVELKNVEPVRKAINRLMESDADARKHVIGDVIVWEIVPEQPPVEVPDLEVFDPYDTDVEEEEEEEEKKKEKKLTVPKNSAITVAKGHLIVSNHIDYLKKFLQQSDDATGLGNAADFQAVQQALEGLGAGTDSFRMFTRTDLAYRTTYELLKAGKMPEAETILAKVLNRLMADEDSDEPRKQQIDGSKLPPFSAVAKYLGPAGTYVRSTEDGWFASGCLLRRGEIVSQADQSADPRRSAAEEATRR